MSSARKILKAILVFGLCCATAREGIAQGHPYYLKDGDTVVFYGDSITEQGYYTGLIDLFTSTRFPKRNVRFYTAGIGGDKVSGGFAGDIDERLQRDVFSHNPTAVTIMLGMNDGGYGPLTDEIIATYIRGYDHILESIHKNLPDARVTILGPSAYDEISLPPIFVGGYNNALKRLSDIDRELARKYNACFVDLNAPIVEALIRGVAIDRTATRMLIPDRIHPTQALHWVMAAAILKAWNAESPVTSVALDASSPITTVNAEGTTVSKLTENGSTLSWEQ